MDNTAEPHAGTVVSAITAARKAWLDAVKAGDADQLSTMVTHDVVVVHGDGRCLHGRDELKRDFQKAFEAFSIEQNVLSVEVVVRGRWAFEVAEVESRLTPRLGRQSKHVHTITIVGLNWQPDGSWKVGRVLGVLG